MNTIEELEVVALASGFEFVRPTKHGLLFKHPLGPTWLRAGTPAEGRRSFDNAKADLARAIREIKAIEDQQPKEKTMTTDDSKYYGPVPWGERGTNPPKAEVPDEPEQGHRKCVACRRDKPLSAFSPKIRGTGTAMCCDLCRETQKAWRRKQKEAAKRGGLRPMEKSFMAPQTFTSGSSMVDAAVAYMTVPPTPPPDPEAMATRVLIKRHKEEHDSLIETFMEGLDWDR